MNTNAKTIGAAIKNKRNSDYFVYCFYLWLSAILIVYVWSFSHKSKAQPLGSLTQEFSVIFLGPLRKDFCEFWVLK